ncbi:flavin reductase family protein [Planotetraspora sp. A-T 1434]|uniref:flavin reductase family protein n=1 Tax=Planotetraspora sp. A-T 1434 TaxID=2979219 RepID=UPI0021BE3F14|nr:flavin reductase family protein [Planotetraspora sp. A-T 1434]MCT9931297.1 flavin reductase family protein [Planotetraspora sp. A-T 1434]
MTALYGSPPENPAPSTSEDPAPARLRLVSPHDAEHVDGDEFRRALAVHAAGVVVVTARPEGVPVGLTATSFSSVSLAPPLVSFYVAQSSTTWPWLRRAEHFAVNVLASDQADLAARFANRSVDRFAHPTRWTPGPEDVPLLEDVSAHLVCRPHHTVEVGDHILVVGLVTSTNVGTPGRPLLYHQGRFGRFLPY